MGKECRRLLRRMLCVFACLMLVFSTSVSVSETEWSKENLPSDRLPVPIEIIPWDELPPDNPYQHLLLCIDQKVRDAREDDAKAPVQRDGVSRKDVYGNTDGIVILTLDTRAKRIMLTSIIRDAIIRKRGSDDDKQHFGRINYVYNDSGPEELCKLISEHLGFRIEKYIMFTFFQVRDIIALPILGGSVDVYLKKADMDYLRDAYGVERGWVVSVDGKYDVSRDKRAPEGIYRLQPWAAVLYMRIRKNNRQGDLMRTQRARDVLSALADKCRTFTWEEALTLANNIAEHNNKTNMSTEEIIEAAGYAYQLRNCVIEELRIPADEDVRPITFAAMAAKEINWTSAREKMQDFLKNSFLVIDDDDD